MIKASAVEVERANLLIIACSLGASVLERNQIEFDIVLRQVSLAKLLEPFLHISLHLDSFLGNFFVVHLDSCCATSELLC